LHHWFFMVFKLHYQMKEGSLDIHSCYPLVILHVKIDIWMRVISCCVFFLFFLQCNASHKRKLEIFHECLKVIFRPPKDMSFKFFISNLFLSICAFHLDSWIILFSLCTQFISNAIHRIDFNYQLLNGLALTNLHGDE
jgi:hypothetical protein